MNSTFSVNVRVEEFKHLKYISRAGWDRCDLSKNNLHTFCQVKGSERSDGRFSIWLVQCIICKRPAYDFGRVFKLE